jgi:hypothetical protein
LSEVNNFDIPDNVELAERLREIVADRNTKRDARINRRKVRHDSKRNTTIKRNILRQIRLTEILLTETLAEILTEIIKVLTEILTKNVILAERPTKILTEIRNCIAREPRVKRKRWSRVYLS